MSDVWTVLGGLIQEVVFKEMFYFFIFFSSLELPHLSPPPLSSPDLLVPPFWRASVGRTCSPSLHKDSPTPVPAPFHHTAHEEKECKAELGGVWERALM